MRVTVKNQAGEILEPLELNDAVFNVPMNRSLVHQAMVIYQANKRQGTHDTKTRAEVSGGGRKPWMQKHTGRARQGSTRSPQWRHGGVVFGPHPREYRKALPRRMRRLALRCVLSEKARQHRLVCLDATDTLNGKTKSIVDLLQNLEVSGSAVVVTALICLCPGVSIVLAWKFLHERLAALQMVGGAFGVLTVVLFALGA